MMGREASNSPFNQNAFDVSHRYTLSKLHLRPLWAHATLRWGLRYRHGRLKYCPSSTGNAFALNKPRCMRPSICRLNLAMGARSVLGFINDLDGGVVTSISLSGGCAKYRCILVIREANISCLLQVVFLRHLLFIVMYLADLKFTNRGALILRLKRNSYQRNVVIWLKVRI